MQYSQIQFNNDNGIGTILLDRPDAMNSMSSTMLQELCHVFSDIKARKNVSVVIISGSGDRAFCAGLDLKELSEGTDQFFEKLDNCDLIQLMKDCGCPIIGAVNGCAITGGFELALACDFLIASDNAKFADTHARVGLVPLWGMSQKLPRLIGINRAKELSLTGRFISVDEALAWGLVNHVVAQDELMERASLLAEAILNGDQNAVSKMRDLIDYGWQTDLRSGMEYETKTFYEYTAAIAHDTVAKSRSKVQEQGRQQNQ